jgi:hypothetical protein
MEMESMTLEDFMTSLSAASPPERLGEPLRSLWLDAHGDFDGAHALAQALHDERGSLIHAYLHRKEGDLSNAGYWYGRAGVEPESGSSDEEWELLVRRFLGSS